MRFVLGGFVFAFAVLTGSAAPAATLSAYDRAVLADHPILYLAATGTSATEPDLSGHHRSGTYTPAVPAHRVTLPNGDKVASFDGATESLDVPSTPALSIPTTGVLTVEAWLRPETLQFQHSESDGYVYWLGKGRPGAQEYAGRMYSLRNTANRPNRISGYVFNLDGGLGSGSYFQDKLTKGDWIHVTLVFGNLIKIYKGGVLRQTVPLSQFDVHPGFGEAPLRIGTRDGNSFFYGAVAKVAVYDHELSASRIAAHDRAMLGR